jgi:hypothetical protein
MRNAELRGTQPFRLYVYKNLFNLSNLWTKNDQQITQIKRIILNLKSKSLIPNSEFRISPPPI